MSYASKEEYNSWGKPMVKYSIHCEKDNDLLVHLRDVAMFSNAEDAGYYVDLLTRIINNEADPGVGGFNPLNEVIE